MNKHTELHFGEPVNSYARSTPPGTYVAMHQKAPTRQTALDLLLQNNRSDSLINHGKAVEASMRYMALKAGQDEETWGIIGLIHDLDYEQFPDQHCTKTEEILRAHNWPEDYIRAVLSHGWGICTDVKPQSLLEKTLKKPSKI